MLYAIKQKNFDLLNTILELKPNILNEYISDELDVKSFQNKDILNYQI